MKKVLLVAPVLSRSGYGEMGRFALRSMMSNPDIDLYVHNINWGKTGWIWRDDQERKMIDSLLQKTAMYRQNGGTFDASVQCTIPNEWAKLAPYNVGYTAGIETDQVAPDWLVKGNEMDKIITISKHSKDVYESTAYQATDTESGEHIHEYKCNTSIGYVGFPVKEIETEDLELELKHDFNFLAVAQLGPRKNTEAVITNFVEEFKNEDVGLLLKVNGANDSVIDFHSIKGLFKGLSERSKQEGWKCSINLLHGNLTDEQMQGLYQHAKVKALVSLTHGEGFGLPLYEAAYNQLPVIATGWSGHLDFLQMKKNKDSKKLSGSSRGKMSVKQNMFAAVKYELKPIPKSAVWEKVLHEGSKWAYVDDADARKQMRNVFTNYDSWKEKAVELAGSYKGSDHWYEKFNDALELPTGNESVVI